jgi:hypothetical protein
MASNDPAQFKAAYDRIVENPKLIDSVNRTMGLVNYTLSTQMSGDKFNAARVGKMIDELPQEEKALVTDLVQSAYQAGNDLKEGRQPSFSAPLQRSNGGRTPYNWRQHYVPKDETIGPVAPARASGYYPEEWKKENRSLGFAGRARAMRNRAERDVETPVDELMQDRTKRATGGRIPEADKLFKEAKKYIDSHTKGLLNEPDEKIVQALRIAKARNG